MPSKLHLRAAIALRFAVDEIHNPGAARASGLDLMRMLETVFGELTAGLSFDAVAAMREAMRKEGVAPADKDIRANERALDKHVRWKDGELGYLVCVVAQRGDDNVTKDPKTIAHYLRLQAAQAFRDGFYSLAACIGDAAMAINCDARNNHEPDWTHAARSLRKAFEQA